MRQFVVVRRSHDGDSFLWFADHQQTNHFALIHVAVAQLAGLSRGTRKSHQQQGDGKDLVAEAAHCVGIRGVYAQPIVARLGGQVNVAFQPGRELSAGKW